MAWQVRIADAKGDHWYCNASSQEHAERLAKEFPSQLGQRYFVKEVSDVVAPVPETPGSVATTRARKHTTREKLRRDESDSDALRGVREPGSSLPTSAGTVDAGNHPSLDSSSAPGATEEDQHAPLESYPEDTRHWTTKLRELPSSRLDTERLQTPNPSVFPQSGHDINSRDAYERVRGRVTHDMDRTYAFFSQRTDATFDDAEAALGFLHQSMGRIALSLREIGWVARTGERRLTRSGSSAWVYRAVPQEDAVFTPRRETHRERAARYERTLDEIALVAKGIGSPIHGSVIEDIIVLVDSALGDTDDTNNEG